MFYMRKKLPVLPGVLGVYLDNNGLLRCHRRLDLTALPCDAKCPILLPQKDQLTNLLIDDSHRSLLHAGTAQTLAHLRTRYWIPKGRARVWHRPQSCTTCRRWEGKPYDHLTTA